MNKTKEEKDMWDDVAVRFNELYNRGPAILVKTQRMFPNCAKYKKCCTDDKPFWDKLESKLKEIEHTKQPFRLKDIPLKKHEIPEGFKNA